MNINFVVVRTDNGQIVGAFEYQHNAETFKQAYMMASEIRMVREYVVDPIMLPND